MISCDRSLTSSRSSFFIPTCLSLLDLAAASEYLDGWLFLLFLSRLWVFTASRILHVTSLSIIWLLFLLFTTMPAPSLLQLSTATAVRNMKCRLSPLYSVAGQIQDSGFSDSYCSLDLDDIGSIPYSLARPFLLKIESPEKLVSSSVQANASLYLPFRSKNPNS